ncbi:MAG: hypothetical protein IPJ46_04860 [Anaerolineales bacterium]|nr:hypothetical protein [Anaerolineales bacterium]
MNRLLTALTVLIVLSLACSTTTTSATPAPLDLNAPSGSMLFQDDFTQPVTGWDRFTASEGTIDYDAGGYRLLVNSPETNFWSTPHKNFADIRLEVDAGKLGGPDENRIGLICRYTGTDYYFFMISSDGFYGIGMYSGEKALLLGTDELKSDHNIKTGLAVNHLRADCIGDTLTFYVNGTQVASAQDATLKSGDVGLLAGTFGQPGVDVIFDNFVVLKP